MNCRYTHFDTPYIDIQNYYLDSKVVNLIPIGIAGYYQIIAIEKICNILTVGITNLETKIYIPTIEKQLDNKYLIIPILINKSDWEEIFQSAYIHDNNEEINWIG